MKSQYIFLTLLLAAISISIFAQTGKLSGLVLDKNNDPLAFTTVVVYQGDLTKFGTQTGENGEFNIDSVKQGIYRVEARYLGSKLSVQDVPVIQGQTRWVLIQFKEDHTKEQLEFQREEFCICSWSSGFLYKQPQPSGRIYTAQEAFPWRF